MGGWMGTLLGGILGFGASVIPEVIALIRANVFHRFSMEESKQNQEALKQVVSSNTDAVNSLAVVQSGIQSQLTLTNEAINALAVQIQANCKPTAWVDVISNTVRPVITYLFFGMFFIIKLSAMLHVMLHEHVEVLQALPMIWDAETSSLFAAIISFWFGSRALGGASGTATTNSSAPVVTPVVGKR
jgi:hypothetical protein